MIRVILSLLVFSSIGFSAFYGSIKGSVTGDDQTLVGVNIIVKDTPRGAVSDSDGRFYIDRLPIGKYTLTFHMIGYGSVQLEDVQVLPDHVTNVTINLKSSIIEGDVVIVSSERPLIQPDITSSEHIFDQSSIRELPIYKVDEIIQLVPGVTLDGHIRGGKQTEIGYYLDGVSVRDQVTGINRAHLPVSALEVITVQTGGFSAEYGNSMSGVVSVNTKRPGDSLEFNALVRYDGLPEWEKDNELLTSLVASNTFGKYSVLVASEYNQTDTRFWQEMQPVFGKGFNQSLSNFVKIERLFSTKLRSQVSLSTYHAESRDYNFRWRYNLAGLPPYQEDSYSLSFQNTITSNEHMFHEINYNFTEIRDQLGEGSAPDSIQSTDLYQYQLPYYYFITSGSQLTWADNVQQIHQLDLKTKLNIGLHHFKFGLNTHWYAIDKQEDRWEPQLSFWGKPLVTEPPLNYANKYEYSPVQFAAFIEDKIDKDYIIVNVGLRADYFDPSAEYPEYSGYLDSLGIYRQNLIGWKVSEPLKSLSPRIGISVQLTETSWAYANYGHFSQIPLFDLLYTGLGNITQSEQPVLLGNPALEQERTVAYEFGLKTALTEDLVFQTTFFMKDITNMIDTRTFLASDSKSLQDGFAQYVNLPQGRSRGLEVSMDRRYSNYFSAKLHYTLMSAKGTSSSYGEVLNYSIWGFNPPSEEYYLSWDQRHTINSTIILGSPNKLNLAVIWQYHSARPYTYYPSRNGWLAADDAPLEPNNARMKSYFNTDLRLNFKMVLFNNYEIEGFGDVKNLFDRQNVLWMSSDGAIGGELGDPEAWTTGRRFFIGLSVSSL